MEHALTRKVGGQVVARHNDVKNEWADLCGQALSREKVFDEPLIKRSQDVRDVGEQDAETAMGMSGAMSQRTDSGRRVSAPYLMCASRIRTHRINVALTRRRA